MKHRLEEENGKIYSVYYSDTSTIYYLNSKVHRENGPAITTITQEYSGNVNGDECTYTTIYYEWFQNGLWHRPDGPACYQEYGGRFFSNMWYYKGKHIQCSTQKEFDKLINLKAFW